MTVREIKNMLEVKAVRTVTVSRHRVGNEIDFCYCGWIMEFNIPWYDKVPVRLETARGQIREFITLDAVETFLNKLGILKYEVISVSSYNEIKLKGAKKMKRMSKQSFENLKVADAVRFEPTPNELDYYGIMVAVYRNGAKAYLHCSDGPMIYPSLHVARRSIKRLRPDL